MSKIMVFCQFSRNLLSCSFPCPVAGLGLRWPSGSRLPWPQSLRPGCVCRSWFQGWGGGVKKEDSNYVLNSSVPLQLEYNSCSYSA